MRIVTRELGRGAGSMQACVCFELWGELLTVPVLCTGYGYGCDLACLLSDY